MGNGQKMKMWQSQLPVGVVVMSLFLSIEYPSVVCYTNVTSACSTREPAHLQVVEVIPTDSVYKSVDNIQLPITGKKVKRFY